jgi:preprotein translocase subunit SecE
MGVRIPPALPYRIERGRDMEALRKVREFFHDVLVEFRRVSWPTRKEVMGSTSVVIVMVLVLAVFLAVVDHALTWLVRLVIR